MKARILVAIGCLAATTLAAQITTEEERIWNQAVGPFRIAGNVYYIGANEVASYLIATPAGHVILDSGFEETVPQILANLELLKFRPEDVKVLINSHAHYDHCGGLPLLREKTGAPIAMSQADAELAGRGGKADPNFGDRFGYRPFKPDRVISDSEVIEIGGSKLVAHITPGHTRGCTTWTLRVEEAGRPLDVVFLCSVSAPGYKLLDNPGYPTISQDYRRTFERLEVMPVDVFLANHGGFFDLHGKRARLLKDKENPFIDREGWKRHLAAQRKSFEDKLADQTAARASERKPAGSN